MDKNRQVEEAVKRMKLLKLDERIIQEFKNNGLVHISKGGLYVCANPEYTKLIKDFEKKYNTVVYCAIYNYTNYGEMISLLYVSENEEEWEMDNEDLKEGYAVAYVNNVSDEYSEIGSIGFEVIGGLILRNQ